MAYTTETSNAELIRVGVAAYVARRIRVCLAFLDGEGFTKASTVANWESIEVSGGGYAEVTYVVATGAYKSGTEQYEAGGTAGAAVNVTFTATGIGFQYNRLFVVVGTDNGSGGWNEETQIAFLGTEAPEITLSAGQSKVYPITLFVND